MDSCKMEDIEAFVAACDNMINSKYILVDKRLGDVLKSIAGTRPVFNLISECMVGFNFEREFNIAISERREFKVPEESHKTIAFVFCLLNLLDDKKLNFNQFLNKYFANDAENLGPYATFCNQVVKVFKNAIVALLLGIKPEPMQEVKKPLYDFSPELADRLLFLIKDYRSFIHGLKTIKKSKCTRAELLEQVNTLILAVEERQVVFMHALVIGIKFSIGKEKELVRRLVEIEEIVEKILDARVNNEQTQG